MSDRPGFVSVGHDESDAKVGDLQDATVSQAVAFLVAEAIRETVKQGSRYDLRGNFSPLVASWAVWSASRPAAQRA